MTEDFFSPESEDELSSKVDQSLRKQFSPPKLDAAHLAGIRSEFDSKVTGKQTSSKRRTSEEKQERSKLFVVSSLVLAASVMLALSLYQSGILGIGGDNRGPVSKQIALVSIYNDTVDDGFIPYYDCSDEQRFRTTMQHRHGSEMRLDALDGNAKMLGVSYTGGLSRETTAILFEIEGKPVIVFVDKDSVELPDSILDTGESGLFAHRERRDGLTLVELSPFDSVRAAASLEVLKD